MNNDSSISSSDRHNTVTFTYTRKRSLFLFTQHYFLYEGDKGKNVIPPSEEKKEEDKGRRRETKTNWVAPSPSLTATEITGRRRPSKDKTRKNRARRSEGVREYCAESPSVVYTSPPKNTFDKALVVLCCGHS